MSMLKNINIDGTVYELGGQGGSPEFVGTTAELEAAMSQGQLEENTTVFVTDDNVTGHLVTSDIPLKLGVDENDNLIIIIDDDLDPNYTYHKYGTNDEIIVRVYHEGQSDQHIWWFFRGWNQTSDTMAVPSELTAYVPDNPSHAWTTANYPEGGTTQNGWVGFINGRIGVWTTNWYSYLHGAAYGVLDAGVMAPINSSGDVEQTNPYVSDPYVYL